MPSQISLNVIPNKEVVFTNSVPVNASILAATVRDIIVDTRFGSLIANNSIPSLKLQTIAPTKILTESLSGGANGLSLTRLGQIAPYSINDYNLSNDAIVTRNITNLNVTPSKLSQGGPSWDSSGNMSIAGQFNCLNIVTGRLVTSQSVELKQDINISGGVLNINLNTGSMFVVNKNAAISNMSIASVPPSGQVSVFILQLISAGNTTIGWPSNIRWPAGVAPFLSSTSGKRDTFGFLTHDGGVSWYGFILSLNA